MKSEEIVIKNTLKMTQEADNQLSLYATKNRDCIKIKSPLKQQEEFDIRWPFEEDVDRILYSKSYQRYVDKTQALSFFNNAHISKRSIHVQWVSRIARQIGKCLGLNTDLIEAAALGHDLGHAPYGHVGEKILDIILRNKGFGHFCHNANSVRNILFIERDGIGYNVSLQVLDAILCHNGEMLSKKYMPDYDKTIAQFWKEYNDCWYQKDISKKIRPMTLEGCVDDLPRKATKVLGHNNKSMINRLIGDLVIHSYEKPYLSFSPEVFDALLTMMNFLSANVHHHPVLVKENAKLMRMINQLYDVYYEELTDVNNHDCKIKMFVSKMTPEYAKNDPALIVTDYLSMMTDSYVLNEYETIFLPIMHNTIL